MLCGFKLKLSAKRLFGLLSERGLTISFAESCTGGLLSKIMTDMPGSSKVFAGGVVAYSNDMKVAVLKISRKDIAKTGAVSERIALGMASGVKILTGSDIAVGITGIAGPDGGSIEKPVGTVCFGFIVDKKKYSNTMHFTGSRNAVRIKSTLYAYSYIYEKITNR